MDYIFPVLSKLFLWLQYLLVFASSESSAGKCKQHTEQVVTPLIAREDRKILSIKYGRQNCSILFCKGVSKLGHPDSSLLIHQKFCSESQQNSGPVSSFQEQFSAHITNWTCRNCYSLTVLFSRFRSFCDFYYAYFLITYYTTDRKPKSGKSVTAR